MTRTIRAVAVLATLVGFPIDARQTQPPQLDRKSVV